MNLGKSSAEVLEIVDEWNDQGYKVQTIGNFPSVVILGESHYNQTFIQQQCDFIRRSTPEFVLHEFGAASMHDPYSRNCVVQSGRRVDDCDLNPFDTVSNDIIQLSIEAKFKVVGCDLSNKELGEVIIQLAEIYPDRFEIEETSVGAGKTIKILIDRTTKQVAFITNQSDEIVPFRDQRMADTIIEYQDQTKQPLVAIMGAVHGRNLMNDGYLLDRGFDTVFVDQTIVSK